MQLTLNTENKNLSITALCCILLSCLAAMDYGLLWYWWVGVFLSPWTLVRLIQCITGRITWRYLVFTLLIWGIGFSVTYAIHWQRSQERLTQATIIVSQVLQFHAKQQRYPSKLEEIGLNSSELKQAIGLHYANKQPPRLFYPDTTMPYSVYEYDFITQRWHLSHG